MLESSDLARQFHGATSAVSVAGTALMWSWWDLAFYSNVFRNWTTPPCGFSAVLFIAAMVAASAGLYAAARFSDRAVRVLFGSKGAIVATGVASALASLASMVGARYGLFPLEFVCALVNGAALAVLIAVWGSVMSERGAQSALVGMSLAIALGTAFDTFVIVSMRPLYASATAAFFPLLSLVLFLFPVRGRVEPETFLRARSVRASARGMGRGLLAREFYGLSVPLIAGFVVAEVAFNFMNYQFTFTWGDPVGGIGFNLLFHVARAAGALACFLLVGVLKTSNRRFFWVGGLLMSVAFATMPFWEATGVSIRISNCINMACFAMIAVFVFAILCEVSYRRLANPLGPVCFGMIIMTGVTAIGDALGLTLGGWFADNPGMAEAFTSALGYVLILGLIVMLSEGQKYLDESTGAAAGERERRRSEAEMERERLSRVDSLVDGAGLTDRERGVLELLLQGDDIASIAASLNISENTLKTHVKSIYRKFGVHKRQELARLFELVGRGAEETAPGVGSPDADVLNGAGEFRGDGGRPAGRLTDDAAAALSGKNAGEAAGKTAKMAELTRRITEERGLTPRESEVFALLVRGYRYAEIQEILSISPSTVHTHVAGIYAKVGLHSHADLSRLVHKERGEGR